MTSTALDLLIRVAREGLAAQTCGRCGASLAAGRLRVREHTGGDVVLELACPECAHVSTVRIAPQADEGVARLD